MLYGMFLVASTNAIRSGFDTRILANYVKRLLTLFALAFTFPFLSISNCAADVDVTFLESTSGVTITGSGSLSLSGLTQFFNNTINPGPAEYDTNIAIGDISSTIFGLNEILDVYSTNFGFSSVSTAGVPTNLDSDPGDGIGFGRNNALSAFPGDVIFVPDGYVANEQISLSVFNAGDTLADFGLVDGDVWGASWQTGVGGNFESFTFTATTAVPEPAISIPFVLFIVVAHALRRKRVAIC